MQFNKEQQEAINFKDGACAVIAGAGSGKSTVLVNRIKNLIEVDKIKEKDILAISFTRNTADDLKKKLNKMGFRDVNTGTFHSICATILSKEGIDVSKSLKEWQRDNCFKSIDEKVDIDDVVSYISYQKNYLKSYKDEFVFKESKYSEDQLRKYFKEYEILKIKNKCYDFDDWLIECYKLLQKKSYTYDYVLIDEHQDSNLVQNLLLKLFCKSGNIFCVFDYRQAIYTFRGGNPEYCMNFDKEWNNAKVINLDTNYRSNSNIVNKANNFIEQYYGDYEHYTNSIANIKTKGNINTLSYDDRKSEADEIVDKIETLIKNNENPNEISVLYRLNSHSGYIECELKRRNIPYCISNKSSFFKRKEVDGIVSYLRLVDNPHDDGAFENIFKLHNYPIKFFTDKILSEIRENAGINNFSLYESFISMRFEKSWQNQNVDIFKNNIMKLKLQKDKKIELPKLIDNIKKAFNFDEYLAEKYSNEEELEDRINSIEVLKSFIKANNLSSFIEYIISGNTKKKDIDGVKLMTIHSSKGLEFKTVFLIGIEDGKFPHRKSDLTDEARLFYVAITRPKENLYLSQIGEGNRFIQEYFNKPKEESLNIKITSTSKIKTSNYFNNLL